MSTEIIIHFIFIQHYNYTRIILHKAFLHKYILLFSWRLSRTPSLLWEGTWLQELAGQLHASLMETFLIDKPQIFDYLPVLLTTSAPPPPFSFTVPRPSTFFSYFVGNYFCRNFLLSYYFFFPTFPTFLLDIFDIFFSSTFPVLLVSVPQIIVT